MDIINQTTRTNNQDQPKLWRYWDASGPINAPTFDKTSVRVVGISRGSCMSLEVDSPFFCTVNLKNTDKNPTAFPCGVYKKRYKRDRTMMRVAEWDGLGCVNERITRTEREWKLLLLGQEIGNRKILMDTACFVLSFTGFIIYNTYRGTVGKTDPPHQQHPWPAAFPEPLWHQDQDFCHLSTVFPVQSFFLCVPCPSRGGACWGLGSTRCTAAWGSRGRWDKEDMKVWGDVCQLVGRGCQARQLMGTRAWLCWRGWLGCWRGCRS